MPSINIWMTLSKAKAGQIITILPIWRDPSSDIGINPRNNWCMQSQIGSPPKIWAHYFIRWSHILCAKIICVSNTEIQILLVLIMSGVFKPYPTVWLSDRRLRPPLNANINQNIWTSSCCFFLLLAFVCLFTCMCMHLWCCVCVCVSLSGDATERSYPGVPSCICNWMLL